MADCIFVIEATLPAAQKLYGDVKDRLARYGREPDNLKILAGVTIFVSERQQQAEDLAGELDDLVPPAVGVDYLSKMIGRNMKDYPLGGPTPDFPEQHVGPTGIGRVIVQLAKEQRLTVRQTYRQILPPMAGIIFKGDPVQSPMSWRSGIVARLRRLHDRRAGGPDRPRALHAPRGARVAAPRPLPPQVRKPHAARKPRTEGAHTADLRVRRWVWRNTERGDAEAYSGA
jgi:alkanesulfonate monooxygenase SsuD/methylene tetrahydromethanopterin reductase-like flavin-dependent oxidoreductase (luciferase family)